MKKMPGYWLAGLSSRWGETGDVVDFQTVAKEFDKPHEYEDNLLRIWRTRISCHESNDSLTSQANTEYSIQHD